MKYSKLNIICECWSMEHQLQFIHDTEDDELYVDVHLITHRNFFMRLWIGLRYAFGYKCMYGNFDSTIISKEDRILLRDYLLKADLESTVDRRDQSGEIGC